MTISKVASGMQSAQREASIALGKVLQKPAQFPPAKGLEVYEPRETDIIVTTFPKSGTTLTQQLTYQIVIATGGANEADPDGLSFDDICRVVPVVDFGPEHDFHPFESTPRVFKSHLPANSFTTDVQKHLVVIRNPVSYPASWLDFLFDGWSEKKITDPMTRECVFHEFVNIRLLGKANAGFGFPYEKVDDHRDEKADEGEHLEPVGPWFLHAKSWLDRPTNSKTLVMFYEDIVADIGAAADRIACFMGRSLSEEGRSLVKQRCDRNYMASDIKFMCQMEGRAMGFPGDAMKAKPARSDGFKQYKLTEDELDGINLRMRQQFGYDCYDSLRKDVNRVQRQMHGF